MDSQRLSSGIKTDHGHHEKIKIYAGSVHAAHSVEPDRRKPSPGSSLPKGVWIFFGCSVAFAVTIVLIVLVDRAGQVTPPPATGGAPRPTAAGRWEQHEAQVHALLTRARSRRTRWMALRREVQSHPNAVQNALSEAATGCNDALTNMLAGVRALQQTTAAARQVVNPTGQRFIAARVDQHLRSLYNTREELVIASDRVDAKVEAFAELLSSAVASHNAAASASEPSHPAPAGHDPPAAARSPYPAVLLAINCGGPDHVCADGISYGRDLFYEGGSTHQTDSGIANTRDGTVYRSERRGAFQYRIPITNGEYDVTLQFAELQFRTSGLRLFNVAVQKQNVRHRFNLLEAAGGDHIAHDVTVPAVVANGRLTIEVDNVINVGTLNAIVIRRRGAAASSREATVPSSQAPR